MTYTPVAHKWAADDGIDSTRWIWTAPGVQDVPSYRDIWGAREGRCMVLKQSDGQLVLVRATQGAWVPVHTFTSLDAALAAGMLV